MQQKNLKTMKKTIIIIKWISVKANIFKREIAWTKQR